MLQETIQDVSWVQLGQDIDGECCWSGSSVAMNRKGTRVLIGARENDGNGIYSGHARIFQELEGYWVQLGQDIDGEAEGDWSGEGDMNNDGSRVIIGAFRNDGENKSDSGHVRVFEERNGGWVQLGRDIDGESAGDWFGWTVAMNGKGTRVIIGGLYNDGNGLDSGHARVFEEIDGEWVQLGNDIDGEAIGDKFGSSVDMNDEGSRVIIGAVDNKGEFGQRSGHARVFEFINGDWMQLGGDIDAEAPFDGFGYSVAMNGSGSRVIIGGKYNNGKNGYKSGHARVYEEADGGNWYQIGRDIDGEAPSDLFGDSVSMNEEGSIVIIGSYANDGNGIESGHARVFEELNGDWVQLGKDIDGEFAQDDFGFRVAMNGNGSRIIISGRGHDGENGPNSGHARIFEKVDCYKINKRKICNTSGCFWGPDGEGGGVCKSTPNCLTLGKRKTCKETDGCYWKSNGEGGGRCKNCSDITKKQNCKDQGCTWKGNTETCE